MDSFGSHNQWSLLPLGYVHPFFTLNGTTLINTWIVLAIMALLGSYIRSIVFDYKKPPFIYHTLITCGEFFVDICRQALGYNSFFHCMFITTIFIFILLCNILAILPWLEEPTVDFNTTLALGIISFGYIQASMIYEHGITHYVKGFFKPFFFMLPLNLISRMTSIISMALRLFGNIVSGAVIGSLALMLAQKSIWTELINAAANPLIIMFFVIFEGYLQAYIFTILTLTFLSMAIKGEGH
jgi:F-type H+-transporting ATPase subunit a